jgi:hypothetical protein
MQLLQQQQQQNTNFKYRFFLFLVGCIGSRLALTAISAYASTTLSAIIGWSALIPVIGWIYIIFIGKRDTGPEVFGDKIWWNSLRPVHALLWLSFALMTILQIPKAWIVLIIDTLFGLIAFLVHHLSQGNIQTLLY